MTDPLTPAEAERLRGLFHAARMTLIRYTLKPGDDTVAADDVAVEAFISALNKLTGQ